MSTTAWIWDEKAVLDYLRLRRGQPTHMWTFIGHMCAKLDHRSREQVLELVKRLLAEGKIKRIRKKLGNVNQVRINEAFV